jgi:hypothetical protein
MLNLNAMSFFPLTNSMLVFIIKIYCDHEFFKIIKEEFLEIAHYSKKMFSKTHIILLVEREYI